MQLTSQSFVHKRAEIAIKENFWTTGRIIGAVWIMLIGIVVLCFVAAVISGSIQQRRHRTTQEYKIHDAMEAGQRFMLTSRARSPRRDPLQGCSADLSNANGLKDDKPLGSFNGDTIVLARPVCAHCMDSLAASSNAPPAYPIRPSVPLISCRSI